MKSDRTCDVSTRTPKLRVFQIKLMTNHQWMEWGNLFSDKPMFSHYTVITVYNGGITM
jgi:hypothetical protein